MQQNERKQIFAIPERCLSSSVETRSIKAGHITGGLGEYAVMLPDEHIIGCGPPEIMVIPTSIDGERTTDCRWEPNSIGYTPPMVLQWSCIRDPIDSTWARISDAFFRSAAAETVDLNAVSLRHLYSVEDPVAANLTRALAGITEAGGGSEWPALVEAIGTALSVRMLQHLGANPLKGDVPYPGGLSKDRLKLVLGYVDEHICEAIRLTDMASVAHLSPFHFSRAFKKAMGIAPVRYIWKRRVECAKKHLRGAELRLAVIALECGFSSQSHMNKLFKQVTGVTPTEFLTAVRGSRRIALP